MVQRDDLLPVAFGGLFIGLIMMATMPFNLLAFGAVVTFLLAIFGTLYDSSAVDRVKAAVNSTRIFTEQIPVSFPPCGAFGL